MEYSFEQYKDWYDREVLLLCNRIKEMGERIRELEAENMKLKEMMENKSAESNLDETQHESSSSPYTIIEQNEDVIYQDEDGTWMLQPAHKEGWLVEPHAIYPQPDTSDVMDK